MTNISEFQIFTYNYYNEVLFFYQFLNLRRCISIKYCIQKMGYKCIYCVLTILGFMDIPHNFCCSTATQTHPYNLLLELLLCGLHTFLLMSQLCPKYTFCMTGFNASSFQSLNHQKNESLLINIICKECIPLSPPDQGHDKLYLCCNITSSLSYMLVILVCSSLPQPSN